jgi:hypothetical protein
MEFQVGLENNVEGRSLAWVLEHPGCFAYGANGAAALAAAQSAIREYMDWLVAHGGSWLIADSIEVRHVETWDVYDIDEHFERISQGYSVNAFYLHDWKPLNAEEIERGLTMIAWSRSELLQTVSQLTADQLEIQRPGERWSVAGILRHVGGAEWWYLDRLGLAFPREDVPQEPFARLEAVRTSLVEVLPRLAGSQQVVGKDGEFWSPRKLLRRAAWHERDHIIHIQKLI